MGVEFSNNYESEKPTYESEKEDIVSNTKEELKNLKEEKFEEFKEVMKLKDEVSEKINSINTKLLNLDLPEGVLKMLDKNNINDLFDSSIYELEEIDTKKEALEFILSVLDTIEVALGNYLKNGEIDIEDFFSISSGIESKFSELGGDIRLENGEYLDFENVFLKNLVLISVLLALVGVVIGGVYVGAIGLVFGGLISIYQSTKALNEKYTGLNKAYGESFLLDTLDDYFKSGDIKLEDFQELQTLLSDKLGVYRSKETYIKRDGKENVEPGITFSSYIEDNLKKYISENEDNKSIKGFIEHMKQIKD